MKSTDTWELGGRVFTSRVLLGTASYPDRQVLLASLEASGCEIVTVSLRRVRPVAASENLYGVLDARGYQLLPNTAGCCTASEAIRTAEMGREALGISWVKLEVIADEETLLPEGAELLTAADTLVRRGFVVLPYTNDDPVLARKLEDVGCAAVMPLAAPIGTGLGVRNPHNLELIKRQTSVPVIVDAGLGTASDVAQVFELGCDAVLLNTAVARAQDPVAMAAGMRHGALGGRLAYLGGRMPRRFLAKSASPLEGRAWR